MKWINHIAIAGATTAVINPVLVPVAILGSTAPDWLEWVIKTVTGVPFAPNSERRFHLFGGRLRTGEAGEYVIAWGIVAVCAVAMQLLHTSTNWYPFFYDWAGLYEQGLIDGKEWKDNRFRFF